MPQTFQVALSDTEVKLLIVAVRQVKHTFSVAEAQSREAGEPLAEDYQPVQDMYEQLLRKLEALAGPPGAEKPFRIK